MVVFKRPTTTDSLGELLGITHFGANAPSGSSIFGGGLRNENEINFAPAKSYIVRIISGTDGNKINFLWNFYQIVEE